MKIWQLLAVLGSEKHLLIKHLGNSDYEDQGQVNIDDEMVCRILGDSSVQYYITSDGQLRLMPENEHLKSNGIALVELLSVLEAYRRFGALAITEAVDYGTYRIS